MWPGQIYGFGFIGPQDKWDSGFLEMDGSQVEKTWLAQWKNFGFLNILDSGVTTDLMRTLCSNSAYLISCCNCMFYSILNQNGKKIHARMLVI